MSLLPTLPAHRLAERAEERRWLVEDLWADEAVGIVGGEPKCCKSFLALDIAVSVAGGALCLRRFRPAQTGRVLLFAAEDALHVVRQRLVGICAAAGQQLADLDIHVVTAPSLRLDIEQDRKSLAETIDELRPRLLVLDPFVRLHRIDENASGEVAPLLAYLRELQSALRAVRAARASRPQGRREDARRSGAAWLQRISRLGRLEPVPAAAKANSSRSRSEHRAAASIPAVSLQLQSADDALALSVISHAPVAAPDSLTVAQKVEQQLAAAGAPLTLAQLRERCRARNATMISTLAELTAAGRVTKGHAGYSLAAR